MPYSTSQINTTSQEIELLVVHPIYSSLPTGDTTGELIREAKLPVWFSKDGITMIEPALDDEQEIIQGRCMIFDKYTNRYYLTFHPQLAVLSAKNLGKQCDSKMVIGFTPQQTHTGEVFPTARTQNI